MSEQLTLIPPTTANPRTAGSHPIPDFGGAHSEPALANPASPSSAPSAPRTSSKRKGLPPMAFAFGALAVAALLWGAWVTKSILDPAVVKAPIASVRLEQIIGEYVQAQARSDTPPEVVTQQTQAFMTVLGEELKARGADGTTVMVGEAVLSQNVPDITEDVRRAIYARVPPPAARAPAPPAAMQAPGGAPPMLPPLGQ